MRYEEFKATIQSELRRSGNGLTWSELRERADLPYERPCPTWTKRLENDIGLARVKGPGRALVWTLT